MPVQENIESNSFPLVEAMLASYRSETPICCLRRERIKNNARYFASTFPGTVLYAVKCNPHPLVLDACYTRGIKDFDVASLEEVKLVHERYGSSTLYFQHSVKARSAIRDSYGLCGFRHFAVDHHCELSKVVDEFWILAESLFMYA